MTPRRSPRTCFYRPESYRIDDSFAFLMRQVLSSVLRAADRALREVGLTGVQVLPLLAIAQGVVGNAAELARLSGSDPGAATRMLDRLQRKGLVRRTRSRDDRRVVRIELTGAGREVAQRIPGVMAKVLNRYLQGFTAQELGSLLGMLRRLLENDEAVEPAHATVAPHARVRVAQREGARRRAAMAKERRDDDGAR